jgi:hypothetical protein
MRLEDYLNEIESWIEQVEDEEVDPEDYDFIDRVVHKGRKGNNGTGQIGAYLAIYEQDGEVQVDEELVEVLEERQAELPQGGRNRFSNILSEGKTKKRKDGNTIRERDVDGHQRLYNMIEAAREHMDPDTEIRGTQYPDGENPRTNKTGVTIQLTQGSNTMTDQDYNSIEHALSTAVANHNEYTKEQLHGVARLERNDVNVIDELVDNLEKYREEGMTTMQAVQGYLDQQANGNLDAIDQHIERLYQKVEGIDLSDRGNLSGEVVDTIEDITGNTYTT